jgi:selenocysteine lyase/cysteine desulfurase
MLAIYGKIAPMPNLKEYFLLDPNVIYLNHGSFGACPRPVFEAYQNWQRELERQPVGFIGQRSAFMGKARIRLANYLGVHADDVVYFPNPTTAINMVARNVKLQTGDEILTTDHEYGAMNRTWGYVCKKAGVKYINRPMPLPLTTVEAVVETFWAGVTPRTKVIFISHITSPTALIFPVKEICQRARQAGILSIIDGAHAIGQIPLDLVDLGCDIYTGHATSGCARRRDLHSCMPAAKSNPGSIRWWSVLVTTKTPLKAHIPAPVSSIFTNGRGRVMFPHTLLPLLRLISRQNTIGLGCVNAAINWA